MTDLIQALHANSKRTKDTTHIVSFYLNDEKLTVAYFDNENDADEAVAQLDKTLMWSMPVKVSIDKHDMHLQTAYEALVQQSRRLKDELDCYDEDTNEHRSLRHSLHKSETFRDAIAKELVEFNPTMIREVA